MVKEDFRNENDLLRHIMTVDKNVEQGRALKKIFTTRENLFITGRAGSGKSTFMRRIVKFLGKCVIVAPTGVAALNAGGQTIHSFFSIKNDPYVPGFEHGMLSNKIEVGGFVKSKVKRLDTIIIDEVSMVRPDLLDEMADILRQSKRSKNPFGGVRIIMFGDLSQLPPVVTEDDIIDRYYDSHFFFSSKALRASGFSVIKFNRVFRQNDNEILTVLEDIRNGVITEESKRIMESRVMVPENMDDVVIVCSTNKEASVINNDNLSKLSGESHEFEAEVVGDRPNAPCEDKLVVKVGAKVLITRNGCGYVNGSTGIITSIDEKEEVISVKLGDGSEVDVRKERWDKFKYRTVDGSLEKMSCGYIIQYPIRLGYSITSHKCIDEDSPIFTDNGIKPMRDISVGDMVNIGNGEYRKVLDKVYSGKKDTIRITTNFGYEICCTPDHKILDSDLAFKRAGEFNIGEFIPVARKVSVPDIDNHNLSIDWLIGYIIGDGSYGIRQKSKSRIDISVGSTNKNMDAYDTLSKCLDYLRIPYNVYNKKSISSTSGFEYNFVIENKEFRKKLLSMGLGYETKEDKRIPEYIYKSGFQEKSDLIRGLFDSDGCCSIGNRTIRLSQSNIHIIKSVQLLLLEFGIISSIHFQDAKKWYPGARGNYCLFIKKSSVRRFAKYINFNIGYLRNSCDEFAKVGNVKFDRVPNIDLFKKECLYGSHVRRKMYMMTYLDYNTLRMADSLNDYFDKIEKNDYFFDVVKSVESTGVKDTYDIEVDIDHHFVSGGIICSNSQGMTLDSVYVNMTRAFEIGQVYTALSRCKSIGGLYLKSVPNDDMIALSDKIASFMERCEENGGTFKPESIRDLGIEMFDMKKDVFNFDEFGL